MRLGIAIERLFDNYVYASDKEWIRDKVAWALYQTWKEAEDRKDEPQEWWLTENSLDDYRSGFMHGYAQAKHEYESKTEPQHDYEPAELFEWERYMDKPKTEPQTDIHDLTDCDFCKDRNCKDCEGGKDEPQTDCSRKRGE